MKAVIDIGSNSVLLLIGERRPDGSVEIVHDRATVTRLSEGAAQSGRLSSEAIARTLECLEEYARVVRSHGLPLRAVATEGVRMAQNGRDFLDPVAGVLGRSVELISGEEEARLSYLSVALECPQPGHLRVIDIGGASTELVVGRGHEIIDRRSHRIGSVRLTEALVHGDPVTPAELDAIEQSARDAFLDQPLQPHAELHGLAGTVTTATAVMLGLSAYDRQAVDGQRLSRSQVRTLRDQLAAQTVEQRAAHPCIGPGRADVIVTGVTILACALEHCGADTLVVRDRGLRYALL